MELTGAPMVFAVWAIKNLVAEPGDAAVFGASADYGREHIEDIIAAESRKLDLPEDLVRAYLTKHVSYDFGDEEQRSVDLFMRSAAELGLIEKAPDLKYLEPATVGELD